MSVLNRKRWVTLRNTMAGPEGIVHAGKAVELPGDKAAVLLEQRAATESTADEIKAAKLRIAEAAKQQAEAEEARQVIEVPKLQTA